MAQPCPKELDDALFKTLEPLCGDLAFKGVDAIWRVILAKGFVQPSAARASFLVIPLEEVV